jgi:molybdopterin synthase catalytic subunit
VPCAVDGLRYEAYVSLAEAEGAAILAEALERFDIVQATCVHRVGELAIGDLAVWVGASAAHRGPAFEACRWIIDEVKARVPIWKHATMRQSVGITTVHVPVPSPVRSQPLDQCPRCGGIAFLRGADEVDEHVAGFRSSGCIGVDAGKIVRRSARRPGPATLRPDVSSSSGG